MAKKKPAKKPTSEQKKRIVIDSSKRDDRDRPAPFKKEAVLRKVKGLIKESAKKDAAESRKQAKAVKGKVPRSGGALLKKASDISAGKKTKKSVKKASKRKGIKSKPKPYKYINPYLQDVKEFKKDKLRKPDITELKRVKKNLQNRGYKVKDQLASNRRKRTKKNKLTKKQINAARKKLRNLSVAVREINIKLGIKGELKKAPEKKISISKKKVKKGKKEITEITRTEILPVWEGRDKLAELFKGGLFKTYVIDGSSYPKSYIPEIYMAYSRMEDKMNAVGSSTPHVIFYMKLTSKICEVSEFDH